MRHLHSRRFPAWVGLAVFLVVTIVHVRADDWPEFRGKGRLGVWNETGLVDKFPEGGLPVKWRTPIEHGY